VRQVEVFHVRERPPEAGDEGVHPGIVRGLAVRVREVLLLVDEAGEVVVRQPDLAAGAGRFVNHYPAALYAPFGISIQDTNRGRDENGVNTCPRARPLLRVRCGRLRLA
jgi:hypothetical protein